jgi:hypothetical protein
MSVSINGTTGLITAGATSSGGGGVATNTALGGEALQSNTTGSTNTAVGYQAVYSNTTGTANTALGLQALYANTTASSNTAIGYQSAVLNTTGANNVAVGESALRSNTTASNNTAVGYQAGYSQTTVIRNTLIGGSAGYSTTGGTNTFVGESAGYAVTSGTNNTIIGRYDGNQGGLDIRTASNYIVLSDGAGNPRCYWNTSGVMFQSISYTDNYVAQMINSTATRPYGMIIKFTGAAPNNTTEQFFECQDTTNSKLLIYSNGTVSNRTGTYNSISDAKLKENIVDATPKLDKLMGVRVRNYNLIGDELKQIGFVAQELETIFPALIDNVPDLDENRQPTGEITKGVKLTVMIPILVKAIQELKAEVDSLKQQLGN